MPRDPAALGLIPSIPQKIAEEKIVNVAEVNQWRWLEESGQWLENFDQTHKVLASGSERLECFKHEQSSGGRFPSALNTPIPWITVKLVILFSLKVLEKA